MHLGFLVNVISLTVFSSIHVVSVPHGHGLYSCRVGWLLLCDFVFLFSSQSIKLFNELD